MEFSKSKSSERSRGGGVSVGINEAALTFRQESGTLKCFYSQDFAAMALKSREDDQYVKNNIYSL